MLKKLVLFLSLILSITIYAEILKVGVDKKFKTIQSAWNNAKSGDEIVVYAGIYKPPSNKRTLYANSSKSGIILRADSKGAVVSKGSFYFHRGQFNGIIIEGFQFIGSKRGIWFDGRARASYNNIVFRDNIIYNCDVEAILFYNPKKDKIKFKNIIIENNTVYNARVGFNFGTTENGDENGIIVRRNIVVGSKTGFTRMGNITFSYCNSWKNKVDWAQGMKKGSISVDPVFASLKPNDAKFMYLSPNSPEEVKKCGSPSLFMGARGIKGNAKRNDREELMQKFIKEKKQNKFKKAVVKTVDISGCVFLDINGNSKEDQGEKGLAGIIVSDGENVVMTDSSGCYSFKNVPVSIPNCIFMSIPSGYKATTSFYHVAKKNRKNVNFGLKADPHSKNKTFSFIHGADIQYMVAQETEKWDEEYQHLEKISAENKAGFILCVGDLSVFGKSKTLEVFQKKFKSSSIPIFPVFGGHDGIAGRSLDNYVNALGPGYYSWNYGGVHFVALVSETHFFSKQETQRQFKWLRKDLTMVSADTPIVICTHEPAMLPTSIRRLIKTRKLAAIMQGHRHVHLYYELQGIPFFCSSPWRDNDWGAGTNRVRVIKWGKGKISSSVVPMWNEFGKLEFKNKQIPTVKGNWNSFHGASNKRSVKSKISIPIEPAWKFDLGNIQPFFSSPILNDNKIYAAVADGQAGLINSGVICLDASNGRKIWGKKLKGDFFSTPVVDKKCVYAMNNQGILNALNKYTGKKLWKSDIYQQTGTVNSFGWRLCLAPLTIKNGIIYAVGTGITAAFEAKNGKLLWFNKVNAEKNYPVAGLACSGNKLFGVDQGKIYCINSNGKVLWEKLYKDLSGGTKRERGLASPLATANSIYCPSRSKIRKLDFSGNEKWSTELGGGFNYLSSPALSKGILVAANHNSIFALDAKDGKKIWELHSRKAEEVGWSKYHVIRNGSSPAIADGKVFIGSDDGYLYIIDIKTGKKLQEINVGCPIKASVIVAENFVCVSDFNGRIYAFNSK